MRQRLIGIILMLSGCRLRMLPLIAGMDSLHQIDARCGWAASSEGGTSNTVLAAASCLVHCQRTTHLCGTAMRAGCSRDEAVMLMRYANQRILVGMIDH